MTAQKHRRDLVEPRVAKRSSLAAIFLALTAAALLSGAGVGTSLAKPRPHCGKHPGHGKGHRSCQTTPFGEKVARLAETYVGQSQSTEAVDQGNPVGWWSGKCLRFVMVIYRHNGRDTSLGTDARSEYRQRLRHGQVHTEWPPPRGAEVFWPSVGTFGHVAISDGGGTVVTTEGSFADHTQIDRRSIRSIPGYAGWALPY